MKYLSPHDLKPEDCLRLKFDSAFDPQPSLEKQLEPFLQALEAHAGEWMPDVVKGVRYRKYSRASVWKAFEERRDERVEISVSTARSGPR